MGTVGYGAPDVEAVYVRARELCPQVGGDPRLAPVIFGLYQYWLSRADYQTCEALAAQLLALGQRLHDRGVLLAAHTSATGSASRDGWRRRGRTPSRR